MLKILTSQIKLIPGREIPLDQYALSAALALRNEPFSFQVVYACETSCLPVSLDIVTALPAESWRVDRLPVGNAANDYGEPGYVTDDPALVPDLLRPRPLRPKVVQRGSAWGRALWFEEDVENALNATKAAQSVLVTVNPDGEMLQPGEYEIALTLTELNGGEVMDRATLTLEVADAALPEQDFCVTNWLHVDCLCDYYGCEPYSDGFYAVFGTFVRNMVKHRQNTLLLPAFTPALDTPVGGARRNVQLVDVRRENGRWAFDFARLGRFLREASAGGIRYFEHCHLFSQWGAKSAPNIYDVDGNLLFGWDTDAAGKEYVDFLRAYLQAFIAFVREEGYEDEQLLFHLSDEPTEDMVEDYRRARDAVGDLLAPFMTLDAMSETVFCEQGLVDMPVTCIDHADRFASVCDSFWVYYTCGTYTRMCANRLLTTTPARTRVLGAQMYKLNAKGFLHWGYNYYYDRMSAGFFDPKADPCGYKQLPGCSYLAYPDRSGAVPSLREVHMREAFDDLRALKLYEELAGREAAEALLAQHFGACGVTCIPEGNAMHDFSQALKRAVCQRL